MKHIDISVSKKSLEIINRIIAKDPKASDYINNVLLHIAGTLAAFHILKCMDDFLELFDEYAKDVKKAILENEEKSPEKKNPLEEIIKGIEALGPQNKVKE